VRAAWEKGKIERAIGYARTSFWPLRTFTDLADINSQALQWLNEVANQRRHRETGQTPAERFQLEALHSLPVITPDYRDTTEALVHKDLRLSFDGNRYCVPPRYVGRHLTIKRMPPRSPSTISSKKSSPSSLLATRAGAWCRALSKRTVRTTGRGRAVGSATTLDRLAGPSFRGLSTTPGG